MRQVEYCLHGTETGEEPFKQGSFSTLCSHAPEVGKADLFITLHSARVVTTAGYCLVL